MTEACTRCKREVPIRVRDKIGDISGYHVPYRLCNGCWDLYLSLEDDHEAIGKFGVDLWQHAALESLFPQGSA